MITRLSTVVRAATLALSACSLIPTSHVAPPVHASAIGGSGNHFNAIQARYWKVIESQSSGNYCGATGELAAAREEPNACFGDPANCGLYGAALRGALTPPQLQLARDGVALWKGDRPVGLYGGKGFAIECGYYDKINGDTIAATAARTLGYNAAPEDIAALVAIVTTGEKITPAQDAYAIDAIFDTGDANALWTASKSLLESTSSDSNVEDAKQLALLRLGMAAQPAGVSWCGEQLTSSRSNKVRGACLQYLALLGPGATASVATDKIVRLLGDNELGTAAARALGAMQRQDALEAISALAPRATKPDPFLAALANLGDAKAASDLALHIDGYASAEVEKRIVAKRGGPSQNDIARRLTEAKPAALEATFVTNPKAWHVLETSLRAVPAASAGSELERYAVAQLALAEHGDHAAAEAVVKLLASPEPKVRASIVHGLAAAIDNGRAWSPIGRGFVASPVLLDPLLAFYDAESDRMLRYAALQAYAHTRTMSKRAATP